ncbi:unnamed protein product, partial [marine sediment metagenome]
ITGHKFSHWEGDISGEANPVNFQMTANISVVAVFVEGAAPVQPIGSILETAIIATVIIAVVGGVIRRA